MAVNLQNCINYVVSYFWSIQQSPAPKEFFKKNLELFSALSLTEEQCIAACVKAVQNVLQSTNFDLSETSRQTIDAHLNDFESALKATPHLLVSEVGALKAEFGRKLGEVIAENWSKAMAQSFYPIASISDENERALAALKWVDQFYLGLAYLRKCESELDPGISGHFVDKHALKTELALDCYCHDEIQRRMQRMVRQFEKNPVEFEKRMQGIEVKVENESAGVPVVDKEIEQLANDAAQSLLIHWPEIEKNKALLKKCIWTKFSLQSLPLTSAQSVELFVAVLKGSLNL